MKILIVTQKVDKNDPVLGFFHRWIEEFAKHAEKVTVVCLGKGEYDFPSNVRVLSLGKERGNTKFDQTSWFFQYVWDERKNYDSVFVHMNQEYVLLSGLLWRMMGKRIGMWRNHSHGSILTRAAALLSHEIFCTSPYSYTARFKKTKIMPAGIVTDGVSENLDKREPGSILALGRIAAIKNVDVLVDALGSLDKKNVDFKAAIAGNYDKAEKPYYDKVVSSAEGLVKKGKLTFTGPVSPAGAPALYSSHEIYVNLTDSGSLDKTILEAMVGGAMVVLSNQSFKNIVPPELTFKEREAGDLADKLEYTLSLPEKKKKEIRQSLRAYAKKHSLESTVKGVLENLGPSKSSSIHTLNADKGLSFFSKLAYLFLNFLNNLLPYDSIDPRVKISAWNGDGLSEAWGKTHPESSAARKLSDLYWITFPWKKVKEDLGEIHIFDTGCGSGNYGLRILEASGGLVGSYTGIDAKERPNWKEIMEKHPNFKLIKSTSNDISSLIPPHANFFMTQSAIEHFDSDLLFFEQIRDFIVAKGRKVMQVHIFPGAATLPLYLFHGLRQYTPRTISKITRIFGKNTTFSLQGLGGNTAKLLHFNHFTWPTVILRKKTKPSLSAVGYPQKLREAVERDLLRPSKSPIFWALVMKSNFSNDKDA